MITESDVVFAGNISRTHGKNGMLLFAPSAEWAYDIDELEISFIFVERDKCFIPFRVEECKCSGGKYFLKLAGVNTIEEAEEFEKDSVYISRDIVGEDVDSPNYEGYKIFDQNNQYVGTIDYLDDSTENVLFYLEPEDDDADVIIPATDEWIIEIDDDAMSIKMNIPEGLVDINRTRGVYDEDEDEESDL